MEASNGKYLTIDFHFNDMFAPNPLVYLDPMRMSVRDVDFGGMDYREFVLWVSKLTRRSCENLYYCSTHERLAEGIRRIDNDADYFEFIEDGYIDKQELRMNVYFDHKNEPILDWADKELLTGDELSDVIEDDDTESQISDIRECEHEPDEEVHTFDKTDDDEFLNKLCGKPILNSIREEVNDANDDEDSDKDDEVVFPTFDKKQEWDKMVPVLGMQFANPLELKLCLTNYAVKNEYDLWFEKNDHQKLLAKCCKYKKNKKSKSCLFRLWATWIKNERSFQIKSLIDRHNCARVFKFGSTVSYKWIGTHFMNDILQKQKMSIRKLKAKVENKESWKWFLDLLIDDIGMGVGHGLTIISYQHKGLVEAVKERVPAAEHRQSARKKPLITMLEEIRIYVMERLCIYKAKGQSWDLSICPSIRLKLNKHKETQRFWQVVPSGYMQFEVRVGTERYAVDLNTRQCGCRAWQLAGYPCVHGYATISSLNRDPEEYVSEWFTTSMYASCYRERGHNKSTCPQRPNNVPSTLGSNKKKPKKQGKVDLEAELEVEHVVMFESESDSDFESESDVEANVPEPDVEAEVDVLEVYVVPKVEVDVPLVQDKLVGGIQDDIQVDANIEVDVPEVDLVPEVEVDANIEDEIQANIEVEHEIEVQDNVEQEIQHNAENQVRKRTRKTSERITKIRIRKNIRRKEGSSIDHPLEI
uniref:SWIM-type domain-containing protein n=1 Tax=Lactuca sativa TaxID=4236 RepID=A0A9R1VAA1_LACSA|nr:hypothetical protein LSAT_V11C600340760 [Lactuca sativa]